MLVLQLMEVQVYQCCAWASPAKEERQRDPNAHLAAGPSF